jgi:hypothetical protein
MTLKPQDILRKGLKGLQNEVKAKIDHLFARLADQKSITLSEEQILEALEKASDYEMGCCKTGQQGRTS